MSYHLRIARPVSDLESTTEMYCRGLALRVIDRFKDHEGFDGVMVGSASADYHFEFTCHRAHFIAPTPTIEDLAVFYIPSRAEWEATCDRMSEAAFKLVASSNPYWDINGKTYEDHDGYRVVLQNAEWTSIGTL